MSIEITQKPKFMSLFSCGGLADVGAKAAGFELVAANEIEDKFANVYRHNHGDHIRVGNILNQDPADYPDIDLMHASPVCTNASLANNDGEEDSLDIQTAEKTAEFIKAKRPRFFTLENVSGYRHFESFRRITKALDQLGYFYDVDILNAADFGVPQTRRRLFIRAMLGGLVPHLPAPVQWIGWYESIKDIIHTFPESKFADWQMARLPDEYKSFILNQNRNSIKWIEASDVIDIGSPYATVLAKKTLPKAFLVGQQKFLEKLGIVDGHEPAQTITSNHNQAYLRAFVVSGGQGDMKESPDGHTKSVTLRSEDEPIMTLTASESRRPTKAWLQNGRIVKILPRGLARFQSVPDSYWLPDKTSLACEIIGNGVPCLEYQRIAESFLWMYG